jgi:hypothetical protein
VPDPTEHKLAEEIGGEKSLAETSFSAALKLAKGTISVIDRDGMSWTRIWCVYELYVSVVGQRAGYTYDMYTALEHTNDDGEERFAVGITQSAVWTDEGSSYVKSQREQHFPLELIDRGVSFKCEEGAASVAADKVKILSEIGDQKTVLDEQIHAVVSGAALERVLKENDERRHPYLEAVRKGGPPRQLSVDLRGSEGDCQATVTALVDALGGSDQASRCEELVLETLNATELPESLGRLTALKDLNLYDCSSLESLPDSISQLVALKKLFLDGCSSLVGTVELRSGVKVSAEPAGLTVTYLSEEEIAPKAAVRLEAQVRFQSIDTNGDGTLDAFELSAALCDSGLTDHEIEALFFKLDSNSDNQVSEAEFIDGYSTLISQHLVN